MSNGWTSVPLQLLRDHLVLAERNAAAGEWRLARQASLIVELERDGHSTKLARTLFATLQESQLALLAERDRLRLELAQRDGPRESGDDPT